MLEAAEPIAKRPKRCLVTGGLGYLGAWVTRHLSACGHEVFALSRKSDKKDLGVPYSLVQADLTELAPEELARALPEGLDAVIHAASHNEAFTPDYARRALTANAYGTRNLLQALVLQRGGNKENSPLVVYPSTFHVYGKSEGEIDENSPALPRNDYALTHFFAEEYCRMFERAEGLPLIVLRISNGYGAPKTQGSDKWHLLLNDLCRQAVADGVVRLHSPPETLRDFVWLGDVASVVEKLLHRRDLAGKTFNVASGVCRSIGEAAALTASLASSMMRHETPVIAPEGSGAPGQARLAVSNKAVCEALGVAFHDRMAEEISALLLLASLGLDK